MALILYPFVKLNLQNGWKAEVLEKWSGLQLEPENLLQSPDLIFKQEKGNITAVKKIDFQGEKIPFVVKKTVRPRGIKSFAEILRAPKSLRNFTCAILLKQKNIEIAEPVAALWHKKDGSIYITEYIPDSLNLYEVAAGKDKDILTNFSARKAVIRQIAEILAKLNKAKYWHRDPKAGNFIIYKDREIYKVKLIDLDGIKQTDRLKEDNFVRTLSKLAETLTRYKNVNFTDLYRGFLVYCRAMEIYGEDCRNFFRKVERATVAARLQKIVSDSYSFSSRRPADESFP